MRTLLLILIASALEASPTHIVDVLYQPNGNPPAVSAGTDITISQGLGFVSGNNYYPAFELAPHPVTDSAGNVDIWLEPNPIGQPYSLLFRATNGVITRDCWVVPVTASVLKIKDVRSTACTVQPSAVVQLGQLAQGGAITGNVIGWNGTQWVAAAASGGGTPGGTPGQIQYNNAGAFGGFTVSGDGTLVPSTGVLTIMGTHLASALPVNQGGTGVATIGAHGTLIGEGTSPVTTASPGTAGNVLTSNGASADPTFQPSAGGGMTPAAPYLQNGSNYYAGFPLRQVTPPSGVSFTAVNGGTQAADGQAFILTAATSATTNLRLRCVAIGSNTTLTTLVSVTGPAINYGGGGLAFYESGTGHIVAFGPNFSAGGQFLQINLYSSVTAFSTQHINDSTFGLTGIRWLQIIKTGGNLTYLWSNDGLNFSRIFQNAQTADFSTAPDNFCYYANSENNIGPVTTELLSWVTQ